MLTEDVIDVVERPPVLVGLDDAFAVHVFGDSMAPRYEDGDILWIHPTRVAFRGDDVIVELLPEPGETQGKSFLKRLVSQDDREIVVRQYEPKGELRFPRNNVKRIYFVLGRLVR